MITKSELAALGMQTIRDADAGIEIALPLAMVDFDRHESAFLALYRQG